MATFDFEQYCRLCLKHIASDENYQERKRVTWDILDVLLLKLNANGGHEHVMCNNCSRKVMEAFKFKSMCLYTDNTIIPYVDDETECLVDLREIYMKEKGNNQPIGKLDDLKVCRLCMQPLIGNFTSVQEIKFDAIDKYIPEINFNVVEDAIICTQCLDSLYSHSSFIRNCLAVEEKVKCLDGNVPYSPGRTSLNSYRTESIKSEESKEEEVLTETVVKLEEENEEVAIKTECIDIKSEDTDLESNNSLDISCNKSENEDIPETDEFKSTPKMTRKKTLYHQCDMCEYKTKHKSSLTKHYLTHANPSSIPWYQCDMCDYKSKRKDAIKCHKLMKHTDPSKVQLYKCDMCDYKSKYKGDIKPHKLMKHTDPSKIQWYKCDMCDYKTKYKGAINSHKLMKHTDPSKVQLYKCDMCYFKTKQKCALEPHKLMRHTDPSKVQLYKCDMCEYKSKYKGNIKLHKLMKHTDPSKVQWYKRDMCDYKTKQKYVLKPHKLMQHTDPSKVPLYKCDACDYKAKQKRNLKRHQLVHHMNPPKVQV